MLAFCAALYTLGASSAIEPQSPAPDQQSEPLQEIIILAPEPRYVVPTRRDRIGRIWAPVYINGKGPFRLVLDSGASRSGVTLQVAQALHLPLDQARRVLLRGVTGSSPVPTVKADSFAVGDLALGPVELPIVTDALGGADGILGTDQLSDRRITVEFRYDLIIIARSHSERAAAGFLTVPFQTLRGSLVAVDATVGNVRTKAIIDTGGQVTIANLALRSALDQHRSPAKGHPQQIIGVTDDIQSGNSSSTPPLRIRAVEPGRSIEVHYGDVTFGDMHIFEHWRLTSTPTMLIGMDALGTLDVLIIDYRRHELQIQMRDSG